MVALFIFKSSLCSDANSLSQEYLMFSSFNARRHVHDDHQHVTGFPLWHGRGEVARGTHRVFLGLREVRDWSWGRQRKRNYVLLLGITRSNANNAKL